MAKIPPESEAEKDHKPEGQGRMAALADELAKDPRPFRELSREERRVRLEKVMGIGRGLMSTSEEFARQKLEEIEIEERRWEASVEAARRQELARTITPEVEKISGLIPAEVDAKAEYGEHILKKHQA